MPKKLLALLLSSAAPLALALDYNSSAVLGTRQALDRKGHLALSEYSLHFGGNLYSDSPWRFKALGRALAEYKLGERFERIEARELFAAYDGESCTHTLGVQQVVWGVADRLRILDTIHAFDLREGLFGDYVQQRRPLAMTNTECQLSPDQNLQLLIVPQHKEHLLPPPDGRFAFYSADFSAPPTVPLNIKHGHEPNWRNPSDWNGGLRWGSHWLGVDSTVNLWHGWQDVDSYWLRFNLTDVQGERHVQRRTLLGGSLTAPLGSVTLKSELGYSPDATRYQLDMFELKPHKTEEKQLLVGLDYLTGDWFFNAQYYNRWLGDVNNAIEPSRRQLISLGSRRAMLQERLSLTGFVVHDLENHGQYLSLGLSYDLDEHWQIRTGIDNFSGKQDSFGGFRDQSRWVNALRYAF